MIEPLIQGAKDVFLVGVRADFDTVEDQALKATRALQDWSLIGTDGNAGALYTKVSNVTTEGDRMVWRNVGTTGVQSLGSRQAGQPYPTATFLRGWETAVFDPDNQIAGMFVVPEERDVKEAKQYKAVLNRAQKLLYEIDRRNIADIFELFNMAFTVPTSYPTNFFAKGNNGLNGANTALNEYLISTQHARADSGTTISNAVTSSGNSLAFSDAAYYTAKEQGATFLDDVGKAMPMFGGHTTAVVPPSNGLARLAMEINGSEWKTKVSDNDINVLEGQLNSVKSSPYLLQSYYISGTSNKFAWFLIDDTVRDPEVGTGLVQIAFVPLETRTERQQAEDSLVYKVKEEYVYGWTDWRNMLGSKGDGAAYSN